MFRILTIIFVIVRISRNIEATQSSKFRLISNLNLSDSWSIENLIETINIPQTGRKSFNQKRYCLAECDKLSTCILSVYDSVGLTCTFYNSGPQWSNGNYLSAQYSYIKTFYKQLSPSQCSVYQYHDGYSCVKASGYYTSCNQSLTCQTSLGLICTSNFCLCAENSYYSQTSCALKQQYQNYCNETVPCDDTIGLVCDSNLCGCSQSYYYNSSACAPQKFVNQSCSSSIECSSAYQLVCLSGICQVNATQGQTCAANCTSDVGLTCLSGVCVCSDTTKAFNGTMCVSPTTIQVYNPPAFNAYYSISYVSGGASKTISGTITAASSKPVTQKLPIDSSSISITFGYVALIVLINIDIATLSVAGGTSICYTITSSHSYTTSTSC